MSLTTQGERKGNSQPLNNPIPAAAGKGGLGKGNVPPHHFSPPNRGSQQKKMSRRSSRPIINWFQRKLSGTVKGKRSEALPLAVAHLGRAGSRNNSSRVTGRVVSSPVPTSSTQYSRQNNRLDTTARRKTVSLNEDDGMQSYQGDDSLDGLSLTRDSLWSPTSLLEADDDASLRPLPPSAPPSPAPSRSSSSYLSDPRTFRSMAASTKPTTVLSIDLPGNGMAHIAQVPISPPTQLQHRFYHYRQSSTGNPYGTGSTPISFSVFPTQSSRPSSQSHNHIRGISPSYPVQVPLHTAHHPRNNPRPSSPPLDNASVLTLASSAYGLPTRLGPQGYSSAPSAFGGGDSISHFGGSTFPDGESTSLFITGDDERLDERDVDASVRALRPRSSRRGSWGSEVSGWSAQIAQVSGTSSISRERSVRISDGVRSDEAGTENGRNYLVSLDTESQTDGGAGTETVSQNHSDDLNNTSTSDDTSHGSTEGGDVLHGQELLGRPCRRSTSLDTVGHKAHGKEEEDLSAAMLNVKIDDGKPSSH